MTGGKSNPKDDSDEGAERVAPGEQISLGAYLNPSRCSGTHLGGKMSRNDRAKRKREIEVKESVGRDGFLVKRHKANGDSSKNDERNIFITVGSVRGILRSALAAEYPGNLCESSLCSTRRGHGRFAVCDCGGKKSHDLPAVTCPRDKERWARIVKQSKAATRE